MTGWWNTLDTALKVFYSIAFGASLVMVLQLLAMLFGFDHDAEMGGDVDGDVDGDAGVHLISVRTVVAFFAGFGWAGIAALHSGAPIVVAAVSATAVGAILMGAVFGLMKTFYGMRHSGTLDYSNAIGAVGDAYISIPGAMQGVGQIEVLVQGRLAIVRAFTRHPETIPTRAPIRVIGVIDQQTVLVEPLVSGDSTPSAPDPSAQEA